MSASKVTEMRNTVLKKKKNKNKRKNGVQWDKSNAGRVVKAKY